MYQLPGQAAGKKTAVLSTTEAEYISYSDAARHAQYLRSLLAELGHSIREPTPIHADNQGAIKIANANGPTRRRKNIDTRYHVIRDLIQNKTITMPYTPSQEMKADIFTKPLPARAFEEARKAIALAPAPQVKQPHPPSLRGGL